MFVGTVEPSHASLWLPIRIMQTLPPVLDMSTALKSGCTALPPQQNTEPSSVRPHRLPPPPPLSSWVYVRKAGGCGLVVQPLSRGPWVMKLLVLMHSRRPLGSSEQV